MDTMFADAHDHDFALLTARTGLEPELAQRYTNDPLSVLAEFGLPAAEPVYMREYRAADDRPALVVEDLDRLDTTVTLGCVACIMDSESDDGAGTVLA